MATTAQQQTAQAGSAPTAASAPAISAPPAFRHEEDRRSQALQITHGIVIVAAALIPTVAADRLLVAESATAKTALFAMCVASIALALGLYVALLRAEQRAIRPLRAVERNLAAYAQGVEKELLALSLSDSMGQVAGTWNQFLKQMSDLQAQTRDKPSGESALAKFELREIKKTLERVPFGVLRFGNDERVRSANRAAARLLQVEYDDIVGRNLADLVGEDCACSLLGALRRGAGARSVDRVRGENQDRRALRLELAQSLADDHDGLIVIQDITHLQEAEQARDNLLYHVTHELRTPLTNIQAYAETLSRIELDDEQTRKECYNVIVSETTRLSRLIEDILSVSQLEVGTLRVEWGDVDLQRLIRQMVQDNLGGADEKKINLSLKLPPKTPHIRGDKHKLAVLFNNMIGNAVKYTPDGGRVDVRVEADERVLRLIVADTGIGIGEKDLPHVFDKFYRAAQDEVQQINGTGLGLAISREIAHLHGGDIFVESQIGKGSTFTVELPLQTAAAIA